MSVVDKDLLCLILLVGLPHISILNNKIFQITIYHNSGNFCVEKIFGQRNFLNYSNVGIYLYPGNIYCCLIL